MQRNLEHVRWQDGDVGLPPAMTALGYHQLRSCWILPGGPRPAGSPPAMPHITPLLYTRPAEMAASSGWAPTCYTQV